MRITTLLNYATDPQEAAAQARELEAAGVDKSADNAISPTQMCTKSWE